MLKLEEEIKFEWKQRSAEGNERKKKETEGEIQS